MYYELIADSNSDTIDMSKPSPLPRCNSPGPIGIRDFRISFTKTTKSSLLLLPKLNSCLDNGGQLSRSALQLVIGAYRARSKTRLRAKHGVMQPTASPTRTSRHPLTSCGRYGNTLISEPNRMLHFLTSLFWVLTRTTRLTTGCYLTWCDVHIYTLESFTFIMMACLHGV